MLVYHSVRAANLLKGARRRYAKDMRSSVHETGSFGINLKGEIIPPVWVTNRRVVDDVLRYEPYVRMYLVNEHHRHNRQLMRKALEDCPIFFNGRWIIACAVVAGGKKGGVTRDNFTEVCGHIYVHPASKCMSMHNTHIYSPVLQPHVGTHRVRKVPRL